MPPKRKLRHDVSSKDADDAESGPNKIARLVPRTRHVSEKTVKSKWTTLPEPVQDRIKDLFHAVEFPVLTRQREGRKRVEAQSALNAVRKNLGKRLPRMPFPPGTKENSFNYESAFNENRLLESQLATMTSSATLLRREIKREETELARETAKLEELERNAKAAKVQSKKQSKNVHPVLRRLERLPPQIEDPVDFIVTGGQDKPGLLCDMDADPDVLSLVKQLRNHLESMKTNANHVAGIREAITRAQSALNMLPLG
ncbi:hypothetical protein CIRG_05073 [Coccidioides immitis RMSCC 2394]|uniref:Kinetochore protein fta7 n=1 Tax=Coccidioides immitis RMSCC 2394 TaxID=404692 RepID=A0A0J7B634_COCIT|nr:hypothetical protein CIRG_05073 [Coccidioides immitis RMSCC 2394]